MEREKPEIFTFLGFTHFCGQRIVVRYAEDLVLGFQHRTYAERFRQEFWELLAKFGLEPTIPTIRKMAAVGRFGVRLMPRPPTAHYRETT